jgi:hypothetical protein
MHLQRFADCVSARTGFDNVVAEMIDDSHKQFSPVVVVFDYQYFLIPRHKMTRCIGSANLEAQTLLILLDFSFL